MYFRLLPWKRELHHTSTDNLDVIVHVQAQKLRIGCWTLIRPGCGTLSGFKC